jgi:thioredoxin 1
MKTNYISRSKTAKIISIVLAAILCSQLLFAAGKATVKKSKPVVKVKSGALCPSPLSAKGQVKSKINPTAKPQAKKALPRLLDLGATKCVPCKMMVPVLDELTKEYKGKLKVEFIDVWEDPSAGEKYKIQVIPTQIFFDAKGKEVARHTGFFPKEEILKTFKDKGVDLNKSK